MLVGAAAVVAIAVLLRLVAGARRGRRSREIQQSVRRSQAEREQRVAERSRRADQILATSSTGQLLGYQILRQIETVVSDGEPASADAIDVAKSSAARKGANALINLQVRQLPSGKWIASGDAVVIARPDAPLATDTPLPPGASADPPKHDSPQSPRSTPS